jgi:hypothetical protein
VSATSGIVTIGPNPENAKVGIGTTTPSYQLDIINNSSTQMLLKGNGANYTHAALVFATNTENTPSQRGLGSFYFNEGTDSTFFAGTFYNSANSWGVGVVGGASLDQASADYTSGKFFVANTGNVGIGIAAATSTLHVIGDANVTANLTATLKSVKDFVIANTNTNGANTVNLQDSNFFRHVMTASVEYTFINAPASGTAQQFSLLLIQDNNGSRTPTFANTIYWAGGSAPPATTAANARDLWTFITYDGGSTYWGTLTIKDAK